MSFEVEEGCGSFDGYPAPEHLSHDILLRVMLETGTRQVQIAFPTEYLLSD
jgi:hypothetical protein